MKKIILGVFAILSISSLATYTPKQYPTLKATERKLLFETFKGKANVKWVNHNFTENIKWVNETFATNHALDRVKEELEKNIAELNKEAIRDAYVDEFFLRADEALRSDITKNRGEIIENKKGIKENREDIYENLELILKNSDSIKDNATAINENKENINKLAENAHNKIDENKKAIETNKDSITENSKNIEINRDAIAKMDNTNQLKFKELEHGVAMVAAMSSLDTTSSAVGKTKISAAVGGYGADFAVALGIGRKFNDSLSVNAKLSTSTNSLKKLSYSAGISYEF